MGLRTAMMLALMPLVCLVAYLGIKDGRASLEHINRMSDVGRLAHHVEKVGDVIHELQKERGYSAGFTASKGKNFSDALKQQRSDTDAVLLTLEPVIPTLQDLYPEEMARAVTGLESLLAQRSTIDAFETTVPKLAGYYTGIINALISVSTHARTTPSVESVNTLLEAQQYVSLAKEAAGLERAMGATGLGSEAFPDAIHKRYTSLAARQMGFLARAEAVLKRDGFQADLMSTGAAQTADSMRQTILSLPYGGDVGSLTAPEWFAASTAWIDALREVDIALGQEIAGAAAQAEASAWTLMQRETLIGVLGGLIGFSLAGWFVERVTRKLKTMIQIMNEFIDGNFEAWVPFLKDSGEIGVMANAVYRFKQLSKEAMRKKETDEAQLNAKHQEVVDLVTEGLNALSQADLSLSFDDPLAAEYDEIRADFNVTVANLRQVMEDISKSVNDLEVRSETMMHSASDLAQRTTQQVGQIKATAEATARLSQGAEGTKAAIGGAKEMADEAKSRAQKSGETVSEAVAAMDRISQSSDRIGQITTMIEDLSFQTNLLALNAGVEAARAGTSGKGFAVVATEVRALASRSADAAMEIKSLISENVHQIESGVQLVDRTGEELQSIIEQILKIDESLSTVTEVAGSQVRDLGDLKNTMQDLRDLTGQNLALADQSQNNSDSLRGVAQSLSSIVSGFNLVRRAAKSPSSEQAA
ncbi:methyl-accepting chemotaxis protein [Pacificoceanicola onchidii]|uniref:methyl-accepting chemotaxis protein n=1 Tax=Pacificoceanicola onchidii TaxID=2562685 RepID=UPI0010A41858|nr:methyl-accepting chemotaxis protein [Pacificoceanicola onchidii]